MIDMQSLLLDVDIRWSYAVLKWQVRQIRYVFSKGSWNHIYIFHLKHVIASTICSTLLLARPSTLTFSLVNKYCRVPDNLRHQRVVDPHGYVYVSKTVLSSVKISWSLRLYRVLFNRENQLRFVMDKLYMISENSLTWARSYFVMVAFTSNAFNVAVHQSCHNVLAVVFSPRTRRTVFRRQRW